MRFLSNFGCKIIFMCPVKFWHQLESNSCLKEALVTWPLSTSGLLLINRARVKCCLLFNQTIECALLLFYFIVFGNKRRIRESDEKNSGMRDFREKRAGMRDQDPGGGGGVLPNITNTGMCRPTGAWFWSSWFRTGDPFQRRFLERDIIFRTHQSSSL